LEDDAAQRRAATPSPSQGAVALSPVPAAAAEPKQLPAAPTAVVVVV